MKSPKYVLIAAFALCFLAGCAVGHVDDVRRGEPQPVLTSSGDVRRVYLNTTNHIESAVPVDLRAIFDLRAGAEVALEVAVKDAGELHFQLFRVRRDGSSELIDPVRVDSGFKLVMLDARSDGTYYLLFPRWEPGRTLVVYPECLSATGRCAVRPQPGEECSIPAEPCDEGLVCIATTGQDAVDFARGTCAYGKTQTPAKLT